MKMKIPSKIMGQAIRDFKEFGTLTCPLVMRRLKVDFETAKIICETIAKRYPNLWKNREENRDRKIIENMRH